MTQLRSFVVRCLGVCSLMFLYLQSSAYIAGRADVPNTGKYIVLALLAVFTIVEFFKLLGIPLTASLVALGEVLLVFAGWVEEIGSLTGKLLEALGRFLKEAGNRKKQK